MKFYQHNDLDIDSEEICIYMKDKISVDSEIFFFPVEETDGDVEYLNEGTTYIYLFPLEHTAVLLEELDLLRKNLSDEAIAQRLVEYRIKDA